MGIIKRKCGQMPPDEHLTVCGVCGHPHPTSQCPILIEVSVDSRVDILSKRELCYHCFTKGHTAKYCDNKPTCQMCGRAHATILHGRNFNQWTILPSTLSFLPHFRKCAPHVRTSHVIANRRVPSSLVVFHLSGGVAIDSWILHTGDGMHFNAFHINTS